MSSREPHAANRPFHLVLTDHQMPGLDGPGLADRIARDARFAALPVVMLSSSGLAGDAPRPLRGAGRIPDQARHGGRAAPRPADRARAAPGAPVPDSATGPSARPRAPDPRRRGLRDQPEGRDADARPARPPRARRERRPRRAGRARRRRLRPRADGRADAGDGRPRGHAGDPGAGERDRQGNGARSPRAAPTPTPPVRAAASPSSP